jgi:colicin import membrane protein
MKRLAALVSAALLLLPPASRADETPAPSIGEDPIAMKAIAARLRDEAADVRRLATDEHSQAQKECWRKFLVSRCLEEAAQSHRDEDRKAGSLESRARAIERELKRREIADKDARRAEKEAAQAGKQ